MKIKINLKKILVSFWNRLPTKSLLKKLLKDNNFFGWQLLLLLVLNIFSGVVLWGNFLVNKTLYHDVSSLFSFFRDNLNALNYFHEFAWWNPNLGTGFPIYYFSILGVNITHPLFAVLAFIFWLLGLFRINISSFHTLYVIYCGFLIPALFSVGALLLARQIFTKNLVISLVLILVSFSPGIILNLSDDGLVQTAYGLFFATAFLKFLKKQNKINFLALVLSTLILAVSLNHLFLYWNIVFIPLFIIVCFATLPPSTSIRQIIRSVSRKTWIIATILFFVCMSTALFTYLQGSNIVRSTIGQRTYTYDQLRPGNPMEILAISTPAVGFEWTNGTWQLFSYPQAPLSGKDHVAYVYLGLLALPLLIIGLFFSKSVWRVRLFILIVISSTVVVLSGYSPLFSSVLLWETPLRAVNHYSDTFFRLGLFLLIIFGIGLGAEVLLEANKFKRRMLVLIFSVTSIFSIGLFSIVYGNSASSTFMFGFMLTMVLFYGIVLIWLGMANSREQVSRIFMLLLLLVFIDISTIAFWHVRSFLFNKGSSFKNESPAYSVGFGSANPGSFVASTILELKSLRDLKQNGEDLASLPQMALYEANSSLLSKFFTSGNSNNPKLLVEFNDIFEKLISDQGLKGSVRIVHQTYNTLELNIFSPEESLFFWRDAFFPYWTATINGKNVALSNLFGFKAVLVSEGRSNIKFQFSPPFIPYTLVGSYFIIMIVFFHWLRAYWRKERKEPPSF
ncbi:hypothetical protein COT44_04880 [Candidatus Shapirobacteria bacterium CG08_land_8_20_14_0_20_39_18]|uniref:Membrane protein 6-pyruvoyl-tetrahydropterin synthase-related domain-containing protein n=1 Tax=Candidatus Shapirobacteria bacterium CG08_land_8_20_14_0_20_39_18 TaxID=1974883 RepID=A0A2M6XC01_9BACT|nr:MAG: hypothetical protein COT44_04880 [Candidatus Shapirobacteria bacterium CG08_land_8_20_14_0_20_39_18]PIY65386.1 MAG: hypothetical protein COY91_03170 [Candidatus Shapirobacteria bacterium CG_4_10_14_0_8_um_filter_39_15]PJE68535.1 MAG: hypothetical protein COU94_01420 [Candidatus Shapirobacteria bacterium CG10_big_fil_rev_8_21_14_0_10_38_8]